VTTPKGSCFLNGVGTLPVAVAMTQKFSSRFRGHSIEEKTKRKTPVLGPVCRFSSRKRGRIGVTTDLTDKMLSCQESISKDFFTQKIISKDIFFSLR